MRGLCADDAWQGLRKSGKMPSRSQKSGVISQKTGPERPDRVLIVCRDGKASAWLAVMVQAMSGAVQQMLNALVLHVGTGALPGAVMVYPRVDLLRRSPRTPQRLKS